MCVQKVDFFSPLSLSFFIKFFVFHFLVFRVEKRDFSLFSLFLDVEETSRRRRRRKEEEDFWFFSSDNTHKKKEIYTVPRLRIKLSSLRERERERDCFFGRTL